MSDSSKQGGGGVPVLSGQALVAAVKAAEAPLLGEGVKQLFFKQLGLDRVMEVEFDLLEDPPDASIMAPVHPAPKAVQEPS